MSEKARTGRASRAGAGSPLGRRLVANMRKLVAATRAGTVGDTFTVRRVRAAAPAMTGADVARVRKQLGASQTVFAALIGASVGTVRAWEQGTNTPSRMAAKFIAEIGSDPDYWKKKLVAAGGK